jgi:hypothetical protein
MKRIIQFHKNNIQPEWEDLVNEFPEFFLDPSPFVIESTDEYASKGDWPDKLEDCVNLRYGVEISGTGWKPIIFEHFHAVRNLLKNAKESGHDVHYKGCILKEKFKTCRDQGDFYGDDRKLYSEEYMNLVEELYTKSSMIDIKSGEEQLNKTYADL